MIFIQRYISQRVYLILNTPKNLGRVISEFHKNSKFTGYQGNY